MSISSADRTVVAQSELFRGVDQDALDIVTAASVTRSVAQGSTLFKQGDTATHLFLLVQGRLKMSIVTEGGTQVALRFMQAGDLIGCAAVFRNMPYPASATAMDKCTILAWSAPQVDKLVRTHPQVAANALAIVGGRAEEFLQRMREMTTEGAEQRIARTLVRLSKQAAQGSPTDNGGVLNLSRQDLAELSGTSLFTVSRMVSTWKRQGLVAVGRKRLEVRDFKKLKAIAESPPAH